EGGRIDARIWRDEDQAVVEIADTGRGIPQEELEDVFVKFFRSPGVQTDAIPGTGIGLAISKAIVEAHGGSIDLRSTVGVGTTFEIRLPVARQRAAESRVEGPA
ncbi:MAG: ATP-binding protein, partial [Propionibacteriales bacterium]|nr:ATP-binding protein [Propionibacteriales bacterium]